MTGFGDLNLKFPLILVIFVFMNSLRSCSIELSLKKTFITSVRHKPGSSAKETSFSLKISDIETRDVMPSR